MSNRNHPLLTQLEEAIDQGAWDRAEQLLRAAQQQELTLSRYGVPLDFIQAALPRWRADAADRAASALLTQAAALVEAGDLATARERYEAVIAMPDVSATVAEQAQAALTQLEERESYGEGQDPTLARQLEETMAQFLAETKRRQPDLAELLRCCAVPPWWDEQMVATIRQRDDGREAIIMEKIGRFSFVHTWPDYYTYSRIARRQLLHEWDDDEDGLKRLNQRLLIDIRHRLEETPPNQPFLYERLVEANLYHTFLGNPEAGAHLLAEYFQQAEDEHRLDKARRYVLVLKDLQEYLPAPYLGYIDYAEGRLNHLHGLHNAARDCFQRLLNQPDLLPDLRARLLRAVGATYLAQQDWVAALANQRQALALFRDTAETKEIADSMMAAGNTYVDIARTAYGQADDLEMATARDRGVWPYINFIARLPLVLYLAWTLNIWDPRVSWRLGQAMDWVVARLFGNAITWLTRAERTYQQLDDQQGVSQVRESLGQVYLALNHRQAAAVCFRALQGSSPVGSYPAARSALALAEVALRRGNSEEAETLLQDALVVFTRFKHHRRIAQTEQRLGVLSARDGRIEEARRAFYSSYEAWLACGNAVAATDLLHKLDGFPTAEQPTTTDTSSSEAPTGTARTYAEPFVHPIMAIFQRLSAAALWLVILFSVLISVHTENGTIVGGSIIFDRPIQQEAVEGFAPSIGERDEEAVRRKVNEQIIPLFRPRFLRVAVLSTLGAYFALYTVLGLLLVATVPMANVQAQRRQHLEVTPTTITTYTNGRIATLLYWADLRLLILNHRRIFGRLLDFASSVTLIGPTSHIRIGGRLRHYWALTNGYIEECLKAKNAPEVKRIYTGYTMPYGFFGRMLFGALTLLLILIGIVTIRSDVMREPIWGTIYSPADLYGLLYLGVGIPFIYWFVVQPLRNYLIRYPRRNILRLVAFCSLILGAAAWFQFHTWRLPLGRPDFLLSALTLLIAGFVLHQHYWLRLNVSHRVRYFNDTIVVALLAIGLAGSTIVQETQSFHWLTRGNSQFFRAIEISDQRNKTAAAPLYEAALVTYERAQELRKEPYIYNNMGTAWVQLEEYEKAIDAYKGASSLAPNEATYIQNLALAYRDWAGKSDDFEERVYRLSMAAQTYQDALEEMSRVTFPDRAVEDKTVLREFLGATLYDLGSLYDHRNGSQAQAFDYFAQALEQYEALLEEEPRSVAGYVGKGWSMVFLRNRNPNPDAKRSMLNEAVAAFKEATQIDSTYSPAFNGLGWAHWFISSESIASNCIADSFASAADKVDYIYQIESAVSAFDAGVGADDGNGYFFRTRAQLNYSLGFCGLPYIKAEQLRKSITDYDRAVSLDPRPGWLFRLAYLHLALIAEFNKAGQTSQIRPHYELAADAFLRAIEVNPSYGAPRDDLREVYSKLGKSNDELLDDILHAMGRTDSDADLVAVVLSELQRDVYGLATIALERLLARSPDSEMGWLLMARTQFAWAERYTGENQPGRYARALEAAQRAIDLGTDDPEAYLILGRSHLWQGDAPAAQAALLTASQLLPDDPKIFYQLGLTYAQLGEPAKAEESYAAAHRLMANEPNRETRLKNYADALQGLLFTDYQQDAITMPLAFSLLDVALANLDLEQKSAVAYADFGEALLADKEYPSALLFYAQAVRLTPDEFSYWNELRNVLIYGYGAGQEESGDIALSIITAAKAEVEDIDSSPYATLLAVARSEFDRDVFGLAVAALDRALVLQPESVEAALLKAQIYLRWGEKWPGANSARARWQWAIEAAQLALTHEPEMSDALLVLGRAYRRLGDYQASVDAYDQALALGVDDESTLARLGWVAYLAGDYDHAFDVLQQAIAHNPDEPQYHFYQGLVAVAAGDEARARASYVAGLAAVDLAANQEIRAARLQEAQGDLQTIQADPKELAPQFLEQIAEAINAGEE